jgi:putative DNA primase/helicase
MKDLNDLFDLDAALNDELSLECRTQEAALRELYNRDNIVDFLKCFHRGNGYLEIRVINKTNGEVKSLYYESPERVDIEQLRLLNKDGFNIYFGVCPRKVKGSKKESVLEIPAIWVDVDGKDHGGKEIALKKISETIQSKNLQPSIIVDSGNGFHLYFLFKESIVVDTNRVSNLEGHIKGVAKIFGGDSTHDINRVLRVPYFNNVKNPKDHKICKVIEV